MNKHLSVKGWQASALLLALLISAVAVGQEGHPGKSTKYPEFPTVTRAMRNVIAKGQYAGVVTLVAAPDRILHLSCVGQADIAGNVPMRPDAVGWMASMTKPITACAVLMLQEEGKLSVDDLVSKYIPELADVRTTDGLRGNLTLLHLLTHTSGLSDNTDEEMAAARTLADLVPGYANKPLLFHPGTKWEYNQAGINCLGRIVEIASGQSLPEFMKQRIFDPLGMKDTTFYPTPEQAARIATTYKPDQGKLEPFDVYPAYNYKRGNDRAPMANGGLYSTALDYLRFAQMLLNQGTLDGKRYLKPETIKLMTMIHTSDLKTGFTEGNGWGLGVCVVRYPQEQTEVLSPGTFGHGGAYGTQMWIDPVKKVIYIMMIQTTFGGDKSDIRREFQAAAAAAMGNTTEK